MALADAARTVMSTGDASVVRPEGFWERGRGWNEGLVAPELGSLSNSGIGAIFVEGSERGKSPPKKQAGVGSGSKSLTSVLIFHADVQSENVFGIFF